MDEKYAKSRVDVVFDLTVPAKGKYEAFVKVDEFGKRIVELIPKHLPECTEWQYEPGFIGETTRGQVFSIPLKFMLFLEKKSRTNWMPDWGDVRSLVNSEDVAEAAEVSGVVVEDVDGYAIPLIRSFSDEDPSEAMSIDSFVRRMGLYPVDEWADAIIDSLQRLGWYNEMWNIPPKYSEKMLRFALSSVSEEYPYEQE